MKKIDLSIIIVSFNTKDYIYECIKSIHRTTRGLEFEIIVVDNASTDDSVKSLKTLQKEHKDLTILESGENLGFAKANNKGVKISEGRYVLFLNPDTIVYENTLKKMLAFMDTHAKAGASTCTLETPDGGIDYASHRGFPTPWNAFSYFSGLTKFFPHTKLFSGYTQGWKDLKTVHEVDAIAGAFMLVKREAGENVGWWDEDYFFNGEDLDFCFKLKERGWKIYYVPEVGIKHFNGVAGGTKKSSSHISTATKETRMKAQKARFDAMKIFYQKHYANKYPKIVTSLVLAGIDLKYRYTKMRMGL